MVPGIFHSAGVSAPMTAFYHVYIDTGDRPVYYGLYTMDEDIADTMITRYLMDDPEYYGKYVAAVSQVFNELFDPQEMEEICTKNHDLISPYVVGEEGEESGIYPSERSTGFHRFPGNAH